LLVKKLIEARAFAALVCLALALSAPSCGGGQKQAEKTFDEGEAGAPVKKGVKPEADAEAAVIETDYGRIVVELYPNLAPQMVERFKTLAGQKFYDGTTIHRIDPELGIIQGGDPNSRDAIPENDGTGSSGLPNLPAEFSDIPYERGIVGAARAQDVNSANCQFFVTLKRQPAFDNRYTVFGRVIEGIGNADVIANDKVTEGTSRPAVKIMVKSVTLAPRSNFK
jgi:cyclophilin family peptidyl-prolyl cis-trans isomerase